MRLLPAALAVTVIFSFDYAAADRSSEHQVGLRQHVPDAWALLHATVIARPGKVIDDATIVIRNGKIQSVESEGPVPSDVRTIDLTSKTVYPGFIDAYSETEVSSSHLSKTAGYWNPNVVPQLAVGQQFVANSRNSDFRRQGIVAQLRAPRDRIIRGRSAVVSTGSDDANTAVLADDVALHIELTVSSRSREQYPGSPMGAVALARQAFYDAQWYHDAWQAADADPDLPRPERNDALAALQPVIQHTMPLMAETSNELFFLRANQFAEEFGVQLIVKGSGHEYRRLDEIAATGRTVILPLNFPKAPNVASAERADNVTLETLLHWDIAPENPARVAEAGIEFAFSADGLSSPGDFLKSLRIAVRRGLDADVALKALTLTPAKLFHLDQQLGSIAAGKLASLIITDGDIFAPKTRILETWVSGQRFEHSPPPHTDLTGNFEVGLSKSDALPRKLFMELKRDNKKATGRISSQPLVELSADSTDDDKSQDDDEDKTPVLDLKELSLLDFSAAGQFAAKKFGQSGTARMTLVFSNPKQDADNSQGPVAFGQIVWPNGNTTMATAVQLTSSENTSTEEDLEEDEDRAVKASFPVNYPLGAFGKEELADSAGVTAFVNATIWTCGPQGVIRNGTVLIRDGRIVRVGKKLKLPKRATVIDVDGMHVTPGIIDCHSHMATGGGVNESTQAITCEVRIGDFIDSDDISIYRQLAGGVTSSNILHGSANPIGGQNQVIKLRWGQSSEAMKFHEAPPGVKFALGENVKQSNWGDDYTSRYPQTRMGVEQMFRDAFHAAREYGERMDAWQRNRSGLPPRRDLELDALREIVEQKRWIHCHSYRQDEILALIRVLDEFGITIGTFQHILEGYKVADEMARHGAMGSAFSDWWAYKFEVYDAIPYAGALMHQAGVVVSFNSDDAELATHLNQEAAKAVKYGGVSEEEALKFVTLNPARQLRIDQHVGSIEVGKHADIVVWSGHPLSNFSRCEQTWIDGVRYFDRDEDAVAREKVSEMRNTLIQKILTSGVSMEDDADETADPSSLWPRYDEYCRASGHSHRHAQQ